jgi:hypothetical protein
MEGYMASSKGSQVFHGKVVLVYIINPAAEFSNGVSIYRPEITDLFGRKYIVGTTPTDINDWTTGLRVGVALDQVVHYVEFADEIEYIERISSEGHTLH